MPRCPACRRSFRTMEDEEGMHDCPHCGYFPHPPETCTWCSVELERDNPDHEEHYPYCSAECGIAAYDVRPGDTVRVVNLRGCPIAGTMGHCHVSHLDGTFAGLVLCQSLQPLTPAERRNARLVHQ